jgi:hypothetical protein
VSESVSSIVMSYSDSESESLSYGLKGFVWWVIGEGSSSRDCVKLMFLAGYCFSSRGVWLSVHEHGVSVLCSFSVFPRW